MSGIGEFSFKEVSCQASGVELLQDRDGLGPPAAPGFKSAAAPNWLLAHSDLPSFFGHLTEDKLNVQLTRSSGLVTPGVSDLLLSPPSCCGTPFKTRVSAISTVPPGEGIQCPLPPSGIRHPASGIPLLLPKRAVDCRVEQA